MSYKCIYNGTIITMNENKDIIEAGAVVINGMEIVEIGYTSELLNKYDYTEKIDAQNGIIMPGFINGHCHVSMSVFRSLGEDIPDRLTRYMFPLEDMIVDEGLVNTGAKLSIAEMLLGGVTTFVDMYYFEDEVAKAAKELGMRAIAGETILEKIAPDTDAPYGGLDYAIKFIKEWKNDELIIPALAPHATYTNDEEHLLKIKELSEKYNVPILIHISEMISEMEKFREEYDMTPVQYLDKIDFLSDKVIGAHLVYTNEEDMDILYRNDVGVIHNVAANAKSGRKVAPVPRMLDKKVKVGLGTDGPMSGNHQDIINVLDQYTKIQKVAANNNRICPAIEAVELGTIGGARAIKLDDTIGSIEVGKKADIIIIETNTPNIQPIYDYYSAITYAAYPHNVVMTMVNGNVVMRDRKLLTGNLDKIIDDVKQIQEKIKGIAMELEKKVK